MTLVNNRSHRRQITASTLCLLLVLGELVALDSLVEARPGFRKNEDGIDASPHQPKSFYERYSLRAKRFLKKAAAGAAAVAAIGAVGALAYRKWFRGRNETKKSKPKNRNNNAGSSHRGGDWSGGSSTRHDNASHR